MLLDHERSEIDDVLLREIRFSIQYNSSIEVFRILWANFEINFYASYSSVIHKIFLMNSLMVTRYRLLKVSMLHEWIMM